MTHPQKEDTTMNIINTNNKRREYLKNNHKKKKWYFLQLHHKTKFISQTTKKEGFENIGRGWVVEGAEDKV